MPSHKGRRLKGTLQELLGWFLHYTLEWLGLYVPATNFTFTYLSDGDTEQGGGSFNFLRVPVFPVKQSSQPFFKLNYFTVVL